MSNSSHIGHNVVLSAVHSFLIKILNITCRIKKLEELVTVI